MKQPCEQCPWRTSKQGKRSSGGFYTKRNLHRLWGQIRRGGAMQSCHLTDPSHPDHLAAGAPANAHPQECLGAVVIVRREIERMAHDGAIDDETIRGYLNAYRHGLTKEGILYWVLQRLQFGGTPFGRGATLPKVDASDPAIGLPEWLSE